ncbi:hypothetical protein EV361DRAFT_945336 [Lentinula raphanica]|nr:hypothetical protein EV361DRAFT_945336 [Lentinula raphanica]
MPGTLRRRHRQELTLRRSFMEAMQAKLSSALAGRKNDKSSPRPTENRRKDPYETRYPPVSIHHPSATSYSPPHSICILPPELVAYIFALGSQEDPLLPLSVSHVCSFWRSLALCTPMIWRRVVLGSHYNMWRETIYRARACTLDIEFHSRNRRHPFAFYEVQRYMHLVIPYINRWRSLSIVFTDYQPYLWNSALSECCTRSNTQVPDLEELCLIYRHNDDTKEFCLFSGYAPKLRRVTVDGIRLTWLSSLFQNLTYLDYTHHGLTNGYQAVQEIVNIIHVCSSLTELRLLFPIRGHRARSPTHQASPPLTSVSLPWLQVLHLRVETKDIPEELILLASIFRTPRLIELRLIDTANQRMPFHQLRTFWSLYTIPDSLRTIHLQHGWYTKESVGFLCKVGGLKWLVIRCGENDVVHWLDSRGPGRRRPRPLMQNYSGSRFTVAGRS